MLTFPRWQEGSSKKCGFSAQQCCHCGRTDSEKRWVRGVCVCVSITVCAGACYCVGWCIYACYCVWWLCVLYVCFTVCAGVYYCVGCHVYVCYCVWWLCVCACECACVCTWLSDPPSFWAPNLIFCSRSPTKWGSPPLPVGQWSSGWCGLTVLSGDKGSRSLGAWAQCQLDSSSAGELEAQKSWEEMLG